MNLLLAFQKRRRSAFHGPTCSNARRRDGACRSDVASEIWLDAVARLKVEFDDPSHGWLMLTLEINGHQYRVVFSHIYPTLERLCDLLSDTWSGRDCRRLATFLEEPAEVDATVRPMPEGRCRVSFVRFPDHRRTLEPGEPLVEFDGTPKEVVLPFWRALRRLQAALPPEQFTARWREPFPESAMAALTALVSDDSQ